MLVPRGRPDVAARHRPMTRTARSARSRDRRRPVPLPTNLSASTRCIDSPAEADHADRATCRWIGRPAVRSSPDQSCPCPSRRPARDAVAPFRGAANATTMMESRSCPPTPLAHVRRSSRPSSGSSALPGLLRRRQEDRRDRREPAPWARSSRRSRRPRASPPPTSRPNDPGPGPADRPGDDARSASPRSAPPGRLAAQDSFLSLISPSRRIDRCPIPTVAEAFGAASP